MESVVKTEYGQVRGERAGGIAAFRGIPYAAPPFGPTVCSHRLAPWHGTVYATPSPMARPPPSHRSRARSTSFSPNRRSRATTASTSTSGRLIPAGPACRS